MLLSLKRNPHLSEDGHKYAGNAGPQRRAAQTASSSCSGEADEDYACYSNSAARLQDMYEYKHYTSHVLEKEIALGC